MHGALLRAARDLLDRSGVAAVTVRGIAARADVAPAASNPLRLEERHLDALPVEGVTGLAAAVVDPALHDALGGSRLTSLADGIRRYRECALANPAIYGLMFVPRRDAPERAPTIFSPR